jgi:hypothetical protein
MEYEVSIFGFKCPSFPNELFILFGAGSERQWKSFSIIGFSVMCNRPPPLPDPTSGRAELYTAGNSLSDTR